MAAHKAKVPTHPGRSFLSALGNTPLEKVDLETLERLEQSSELDYYLDPAAPGILYTLVQTHIKSRPNRNLFDDQYGVVFVKILIRLIQVVSCTDTNLLEFFQKTMDAEHITDNTLTYLAHHMASELGGLGFSESAETHASPTVLLEKVNGLFSYDALASLVDILWRDRKQLFSLYEKGSLPGVALLLCVLWERINSLKVIKNRALVFRLRDLSLRCYLVTASEGQRIALRFLCIQMYRMVPNSHEEESRPCDLEDSQRIIQAYSRSLVFITGDEDPLSNLKLDVYRYLLEFVLDLSKVPSIQEEDLCLVAATAIERLWIAFDFEQGGFDRLPGARDLSSQVRYYIGDLTYALTELLDRVRKSRQSPKRILEVLAHGGWPNAVARYLLLCFRMPVPSDFLTHTTGQFPPLAASVWRFMPVSREVFADTYYDWLKTHAHLRLLYGFFPRGGTNVDHVTNALKVWATWGNSVGFEFPGHTLTPRGELTFVLTEILNEDDCTNPRCAGGRSIRICGVCGLARYCSLKCQRDDWTSSVSGSHRGICQGRKDVGV